MEETSGCQSDVGGVMISAERAREIASCWQSPGAHGRGIAVFASTGEITDELLADIEREIGFESRHASARVANYGYAGEHRRNLRELRALRAFIDAERGDERGHTRAEHGYAGE